MRAKAKIRGGTISARVIRADGRVEELGVIARVRRQNIFKRLIGGVRKWLRF